MPKHISFQKAQACKKIRCNNKHDCYWY